MELTIDQALKKGVEAHKAGQVQEADRIYTAILKANPNHPDTNHNMGILGVDVGKVEEALPFFKKALEVNSSIAQYWRSYIDALIKLDRMDDAKTALDQAKSSGAERNGFDQLDKKLTEAREKPLSDGKTILEVNPQRPNVLDNLKLDQAIKLATKTSKEGSPEEAKRIYQDILAKFPKNKKAIEGLKRLSDRSFGKASKAQDPPQKQLQTLIKLHGQGQYQRVLNEASKLLVGFPKSVNLYNIIGVTSKDLGKLDEAISAYTKALSIKPDFADGYYNMANAFQSQGKLDEAIEAYTIALSIKPDYAEAYSNLAVIFKDQDRLDEAIEAFNKAIYIKPDYAEAFYNMGLALKYQGKLEEAIEACNKALSIKPDFAEAWQNTFFQLQAIKTQISPEEDLTLYYPADTGSNYGKIQLRVLDYKLHRGHENEERYLDETLDLLSSADDIVIRNPKFDNGSNGQEQSLPDKMVALVHFGRSGTGLMHSLVDGHPEVSSLPSIYFSEYFDHATWVWITSTGWDGMIDRFVSIYEVLFDASSSVPVETKSKKLIHNIGKKEGMANVGDKRNEILRADKGVFRKELKCLMASYNELNAFVFFKLVHNAYNAAINDSNSKNLIFYHIHNPDTYAQLNFARFNPDVNWLLMVREPIQSCESWIGVDFSETDYFSLISHLLHMLFEVDNIIYHKQGSIGVRLEDLKEHPRKTIPALCKWLGIEQNDILYKMTAQGKKWWGDPSSPDFEKDGYDPFGKTSIKRKTGLIFSEKDQFILRTLFYPFSVRFGYTEENEEQFKNDLQKIRPMIDELFDFEKKIAQKMQMSCEKLIGSGSYLYLRSGLIERWNTLTKYQTYPKMIEPLRI